ncbi:short-chain type dehydrogenase/reductase domain protein [Mycobacterium xenopi 4042]|uniref:Short-chain type dehydrogenase/reductase domain protein n=1 Tax=Mycobacterium xenopi 4042 TaxID=1299334 RepID=X8E0P1_MYCXE|nr:short-chain type dehydrogenase/reductase domain protein [Mycobacterium xenopi 4042]
MRQEMALAGHPVKVTAVHPAVSRLRSPETPPPPKDSTRTN